MFNPSIVAECLGQSSLPIWSENICLPWNKNSDIYLGDNFSLITEEITAEKLVVEGGLLSAFCGRPVCNGPNPITLSISRIHHWFIRGGMVHRGVHV